MMIVSAIFALSIAAHATLPTPTPQQYDWHEQERIMFVCLDPCTWQGREYDDHSTDLADMKLPKLDTEQWCEAAVSWGAKEILFVAKHTGGFCWWQTDTSDYSVKNIAWKGGEGDVLVELAKSCRKHALTMGIYVYPGDDTWGAGIGSGGKTKDPGKQEAYNAVFRQQLRETLERAREYTTVSEVWFDGSCVIEVGDIIEECAPDAVVFQGPHASIRWVGNEKGRLDAAQAWSTLSREDLSTGTSTAVHSTPEGDAWAPLEIDVTLYDHFWFWAEENEQKRKSLDELMRVYYQSAGQGAVMLLNSTPTTEGLIPEADMTLYRALGAEIDRRFGTPLADTAGVGNTIVLNLGHTTPVNHVVVMEDYRLGERIRAFEIEGWSKKGGWQVLATGHHVGRKRIVWFDDAAASKIRFHVSQAAAEPSIRSLAAYHVDGVRIRPEGALSSPWQQCGAWARAAFEGRKAAIEIDLTPFITEPGQYQVQFKTVDGRRPRCEEEVLLQSGQASAPGILRRTEGEQNTFDVNRTAVITDQADIRLKVVLNGKPSEGIVLIRQR
ncbi:MAG: alpha-L-fucosidase [Candidatus Hydrogenedentes bacterium]|nr:alpha-L-fucosidase [Candidatus Hydrogenedentota bacterium]